MKNILHKLSLKIDKLWYHRHPLRWLLLPFSWCYQCVVLARRFFLESFCQQKCSVPIIVVGNLSVGGVGKTPLVIALAKALREKGLRVGIVSRGYGATVDQYPHEVRCDAKAKSVGDEPLLLANRTGCPVVIDPKRVRAVKYLLDNHQVQVILSDDGLQHYAMGRTIEIVVIDGERGLGNGLLLPAGPLRESAARLKQVDFVIVNGGQRPDSYAMNLIPGDFCSLTSGKKIAKSELAHPITAIAAIGNPQRFFSTLSAMGLTFSPIVFADHHAFSPGELSFGEKTVIMTEKDAVKCRPFATNTMYYLPVEAKLSDEFWQNLWSHEQLKEIFKYEASAISS